MAKVDTAALRSKTRHDIAQMVVAGELSEADALAFGRERGEKQIADAIQKARSKQA